MKSRRKVDSFDVMISGKRWTVELHTRRSMPKGIWGYCDRRLNIIQVRKDLSPQNFLDTLIHEVRHAQHEVMFEAEDYITRTSTEIAIAVIASGLVTVGAKK